MDRHKEFLRIVEHTGIQQNSFIAPEFYVELKNKELETEKLLEKLSKITPYESFKSQGILAQCFETLKQYKSIQIDEDVGRDKKEVIKNLKSIARTKYLKFTIKLNKINRRLKKDSLNIENEQIKSKSIPENPSQNFQQQMIAQQPIEESKTEYLEERRRIITSITEIGQIVEDISMHVNLQEEQLSRIDDVLLKSDKWTKKALNELNDIWDIYKGSRSFMIKFFLFWIIIIFCFWIFHKI